MEVSNFWLTKYVWGMGMLRVIFNIELGNYYSKSTSIMTLIKQEKLVFRLVILYGSIFMFLHDCLRVTGYPKISNFGYPVPEITLNVQPYCPLMQTDILVCKLYFTGVYTFGDYPYNLTEL